MRTTTAAEQTVLHGRHRSTFQRVLVEDGTGAFRDYTTLGGRNRVKSVEFGASVDEQISGCTIELAREVYGSTIAPFIEAAPLNQSGGEYSPLLDLGREVRIETATVARGTEPAAGDWKIEWQGEVDAIDASSGPNVRLECKDLGQILLDRQIRAERVYGSAAGIPLETVLQAMLDDELGAGVVTLVTPVASTWLVRTFTQQPGSLLEALRAVAQGRGWDVRYQADATTGVHALTLYEPDRTKTLPDWTFGPKEYLKVSRLGIARERIRNDFELLYFNRATKEQATAVDSDVASMGKYGVRFCRFVEPEGSSIDSPEEAAAFLSAAKFDLRDPLAEMEIELLYFWPVQLGDLYRFTANGRLFDVDQTLAVVAYRHTLQDGSRRTTITVRGRPAGAYSEWLRKEVQLAGVNASEPEDESKYNWRATYTKAEDLTTVLVGLQGGEAVKTGWLYEISATAPYTGAPRPAANARPTKRLDPLPDGTFEYLATRPAPGTKKYLYIVPRSDSLRNGEAKVVEILPAQIPGEGIVDLGVTETQLGPAAATTTKLGERAVTTGKVNLLAITEQELANAAVARRSIIDLAVDELKLAAAAVTEAKVAVLAISTGKLQDLAATAAKIGNAAVEEAKLAALAVTTGKLAELAATAGKIGAAAVEEAKLAALAVTTGKLADLAATAGKIGAAAVEEAKLAALAVTNGKLGELAVGTSKLALLGVTAAILAASSVTETKIDSLAVSTPKLAAQAVTATKVATATLTANEIAASTITGGNIAAGTISGTNIAGLTITAAKLVSGTITTTEIAAGTIQASNIASATITGTQIAGATITAGKLVSGTITTTQIAAGTIQASNIASGTITATEIAGATITAAKLVSGTITANEIAAGAIISAKVAASAITAGHIQSATITGDRIAANTIQAGNIAAATITGDRIAAGTITGGNIVGLTITGDKIVGGTITADKLTVSDLSAISATFTGTVRQVVGSSSYQFINASGAELANIIGALDSGSGKGDGVKITCGDGSQSGPTYLSALFQKTESSLWINGFQRFTFTNTNATASNGSWVDSSDARLKAEVEPIENGLSTLLRLRGVRYSPSELGRARGMSDQRQVGFLAQDVEEVAPELVSYDEEGYAALAYARLIAYVPDAIRELEERIRHLEALSC